ncbi:carbohydrate-binding module family 50 protein [Daldinia childiae]|uniref:carbohydrate-binding module family 50 protein n=1 Tax=Daldinia childiae TaxID=326645 RepID=UPI001445808B|nr:carbohydrate-binding module family 50 protein [Daldinia childiae]KAF3056280.1 carbohydrate-binding module family 50 protein [Daldinia childiae]
MLGTQPSIATAQDSEFGWTTTDAPPDIPTFTGNYTFTPLPEVNSTFVAEPIQTGIIGGCLAFYQAQSGDTCRNIVDGHYLTEEDFMAMNPALNGNCDGLWTGYYYCVVGPSGITAMPPTATSPPATIPSGQTGDCLHWYQRDGESCTDIVTMFGIFSLSDFLAWNPSLGGESCGGIVDGACTDTCDSIISANGLTPDLFYQWNPAVGSGTCDNLAPDFYVCVAVGDSASLPPSTTSSSPTSTIASAITTPTPVQAGMVSGCRRFYKAQTGDGCWAIANSAGISLDDFYAWNPALGTDCGGLWLDNWYCIGIAGPVTTISSGPPVPTS